MNQRIETPAATEPQASSRLDAMTRDIGSRLVSIGKAIIDSDGLSPEDRADLYGRLLDELSHEHMRLSGGRDASYDLARIESEALAEEEDARCYHVNDPREGR